MSMRTLDLADPNNFVNGLPIEYLAELRRNQPIHWYERPDSYGYWVFSRHKDVANLLADSERFINAPGLSVRVGEPQIAEFNTNKADGGLCPLSYTDAPEHFPLRKVVSSRFKPSMIKSVETEINTLVKYLFSKIDVKTKFDFIEQVAKPMPFAVLARMLGISEEYHVILSEYLGFFEGDEEIDSTIDMAKFGETNEKFFSAMESLYSERKLHQKEDVISDLLTAKLWDKSLVSAQINGILMQLLIAGNETTRNAAGFGVQLFGEFPAQFDLLKNNPNLIGNAVEEILRLKTSIQYIRRTAAVDCEIEGFRIRKGDAVYLSISSANRDEDVFDSPDQFDITRDNRKVISFGSGEHFCVGANLARMELKALFEHLSRNFSGVEIMGKPVNARAHQIVGLRSLTVKLIG